MLGPEIGDDLSRAIRGVYRDNNHEVQFNRNELPKGLYFTMPIESDLNGGHFPVKRVYSCQKAVMIPFEFKIPLSGYLDPLVKKKMKVLSFFQIK